MRIIIVGAGFTGVQLARRLISEHNDVVLIDNNEETVKHVSNRLDCMVVQADGNSLHVLEEAGIAKADALVAVTNFDELNMITCSLVDSIYPSILKIARVRNYDYYINDVESKTHTKTNINHLYGIDYMVHPDVEAADAIVKAVERGAASEVFDFGNSTYELTHITIEKGSNLDGIEVQNLRQLTDHKFIVAFIEKNGIASMPYGSTILSADDRIGILTAGENVKDFMTLCGSKVQEMHKIALLGAGRIGTCIAEKLLEKKVGWFRLFGLTKKIKQDFIIIDSDDKLTKEVAGRFPSANVCRADIADDGIIEEEGLDSCDLIIAATHNHEKNMVTSAYLKSLGVKKTVCLVASSSYALIARNIGIDVAVPIKDTVVDSIMSHLRGKSVTGIHTVSKGELEILEIELPEHSEVIGKSLRDIAEAGSFLILMVCKNGTEEYIIPGGNTILEMGDKVVVIDNTKDSTRIMSKFGVLK